MKKLELKHLSCYLPYGLMIKSVGKTTQLKSIDIGLQIVNFGWVRAYELDEIKPILRPLSDLTKEIEVDGKKFVPALILWQVSAKEEEEFEIYGTIPEYWEHCMNLNFENDLDYREMKLLFEWKFDVFYLIEKGLAININEL